MIEYYHELITEKSWRVLQDLRKRFKFILIGGWAIFLYTKALKSKDIDIIIDYDELEKFKKELLISQSHSRTQPFKPPNFQTQKRDLRKKS